MEGSQKEVEEKYVVAINMTALQHEVIKNLFGHNDWEYEEILVQQRTGELPTQDQQGEEENYNPGFIIEQDHTENECAYCLCKPCITHEKNRQLWWEDEDHEPQEWNSGLRKDLYKRFWTMLYHRKVWVDPRYITRKDNALQQDPKYKKFAWIRGYHKRDLMPECVLKLVRRWFPNPPSAVYMGHRW